MNDKQQELIRLDVQARTQALDLSRNFIVQAPAGSGKTEVLTQRYLALLGRVEHPEEIIGITFTKKAAAEMKHRILAALSAADSIAQEPSQEPERTRWRLAQQALQRDSAQNWGLLQAPGRLRLMTIDSLCSRIHAQAPLASPRASARIHTAPQELYSKVVQRLLRARQEDAWAPALSRLLQYFYADYGYFQHKLEQLLMINIKELFCAFVAFQYHWN